MTIAVFLNYRTPRLTVAAVRSLEASRPPVAAIIVVDNGSADGSVDVLSRELPLVRVMAADSNGGFSAGCNIGIREALQMGADRVLLLNSDVVVPMHAIDVLERSLDERPDIGIVSPVLLTASEPHKIESFGIVYRPRRGRMWHEGCGTRASAVPSFNCRIVDAVSGCAMLIRREVFERAGLLAEEFFFGFEDVDFCLRAADAGFRTACLGNAIVYHEGQGSIGRISPRRIYFATRNHLLLAARRRAGPRRMHSLQTVSILALNLTHAILTSNVSWPAGVRAVFRGARDHFAGRYGPPPSGIDAF